MRSADVYRCLTRRRQPNTGGYLGYANFEMTGSWCWWNGFSSKMDGDDASLSDGCDTLRGEEWLILPRFERRCWPFYDGGGARLE